MMSVALDSELATTVLNIARRDGVNASRVLRELVAEGLASRGNRVNHSLLQRREAVREVKAQVLGEVRGAVAEAMNRTWAAGEPGPKRRPGR